MPPPSDEQIAARDAWVVDSLERRMAIAEGLAANSRGPLDWLAVQRQVRRFLGYAGGSVSRNRSDSVAAEFDAHLARLRELQSLADKELSTIDPDALAEARTRLGLRVAVIGKGGAGKTVISSTLARTLAERGRKVFAADLDTCPGLAFGLGIPVDDAGLPGEALEEQPAAPYGWQLAGSVTPAEAVERFGAEGPDGIRFLGLGKIGSADTTTGRSTVDKDKARMSVAAVRQILMGFAAPDWDVIADLEAGPTTPFENYHEFAEDVVVVVGPAWRSAMTARRLLPMVGDRRLTIVANRFRDEPDHPGFTPAIRIPNDPALTQAEREGRSPFEACPDSPAVEEVVRLADLLLAQAAAGEDGGPPRRG
jgi:CO dehydrogenase nickel-insertion accessory protein CooC1